MEWYTQKLYMCFFSCIRITPLNSSDIWHSIVLNPSYSSCVWFQSIIILHWIATPIQKNQNLTYKHINLPLMSNNFPHYRTLVKSYHIFRNLISAIKFIYNVTLHWICISNKFPGFILICSLWFIQNTHSLFNQMPSQHMSFTKPLIYANRIHLKLTNPTSLLSCDKERREKKRVK